MESLTHEIITTTYEDLEKNLKKIPMNRQVGLVVLLNDIKYEFLLHIKPQYDDIICLGPSGLSDIEKIEEFKSRPMFTRHKWDFDKSILLYNDNTRYVWEGETGSGWGIGLPGDYFLENIKNMIVKITQFFDILPHNILFYGSSMGGFTSIQLATMIKNSFAIAENPQFDARIWIKNYYLKNGMHSKLYEKETLKQIEPFKYDVVKMIRKEKYIPNLTIIQDRNPEDIKNHLIYFLTELHKLPFRREDFHKIRIVMEPNVMHVPVPKEKLYEIFEVHDAISKHKFKYKIDYAELDLAIKKIKELNLFDEKFYTETYSNIGQLDPLTHYLLVGWKEGKNPSRHFETEFYLQIHDNVSELGVNPLIHYVIHGIDDNLATSMSEYLEDNENLIKVIENSELFDEEYYIEHYGTTENLTPAQHYFIKGWREGRNPSARFDTEFYLFVYDDVSELGINPLVHYITQGIENDFATNQDEYINKHKNEISMIENSRLFDEKYYVKHCCDLENLTPAQHYFIKGWKWGNNPSRFFDNRYYLEKYSDVRNFGLNPLYHYLRYGKDEKRFINKREENISRFFGKIRKK